MENSHIVRASLKKEKEPKRKEKKRNQLKLNLECLFLLGLVNLNSRPQDLFQSNFQVVFKLNK